MNQKVFRVPSLPPPNDPIPSRFWHAITRREVAHMVLGCEFTVAFVYYMLQRQYLLNLNDPKLLESLFYLVQAMALCRGDQPGEACYGDECGEGVRRRSAHYGRGDQPRGVERGAARRAVSR